MKHIKLFEEFINESDSEARDFASKMADLEEKLQKDNKNIWNKFEKSSSKFWKEINVDSWEEAFDKDPNGCMSFQEELESHLNESLEFNESANLPKGLEQFAADEKAEGKKAEIHLAKFTGKTFKAQSTNKVWDDGVPVTKNFTRGGYKSVTIKGEHHIIEGDTFWYFRVGDMWYAVKMADYGTPPFEY
jgi:hypothetical protein